MTLNRSLFRVAALTGVAAFLLTFAHVSPVAAQTSTRHAVHCSAVANSGVNNAECTINVPAGKVFIIESATFGGASRPGELPQVRMLTKKGGATISHTPLVGFQLLDHIQTWWSGAIPGTIFSEAGPLQLNIWRGPAVGQTWIRMALSGRLEDM